MVALSAFVDSAPEPPAKSIVSLVVAASNVRFPETSMEYWPKTIVVAPDAAVVPTGTVRLLTGCVVFAVK
jgi:hypothetical protein